MANDSTLLRHGRIQLYDQGRRVLEECASRSLEDCAGDEARVHLSDPIVSVDEVWDALYENGFNSELGVIMISAFWRTRSGHYGPTTQGGEELRTALRSLPVEFSRELLERYTADTRFPGMAYADVQEVYARRVL